MVATWSMKFSFQLKTNHKIKVNVPISSSRLLCQSQQSQLCVTISWVWVDGKILALTDVFIAFV